MERFYFYTQLIRELLDKLNQSYEDENKKLADSYFLQIQALLSRQEYMFREKVMDSSIVHIQDGIARRIG